MFVFAPLEYDIQSSLDLIAKVPCNELNEKGYMKVKLLNLGMDSAHISDLWCLTIV